MLIGLILIGVGVVMAVYGFVSMFRKVWKLVKAIPYELTEGELSAISRVVIDSDFGKIRFNLIQYGLMSTCFGMIVTIAMGLINLLS
jgi:hypothetical protein